MWFAVVSMAVGGIEYFTVYALLLVSGLFSLSFTLWVYHIQEVVYYNYSDQLPSSLSIFLVTWGVLFAIFFLTKNNYILIYQYEEWEE